MANQALTEASNYFDLQGLDQLRQKAQGNSKESIREVANQFESMFASMLIKSMRKTNEAFETESPFNNKQTKFYTDMQDNQLALDISRHGSLGLADALVRQLDPSSMASPTAVATDQLKMPNAQSQAQFELHPQQAPIEFNQPDTVTTNRVTEQANKTDIMRVTPTVDREQSSNGNPVNPLEVQQPAVNGEKLPQFTDKKSFIEALMPYAKKTAQSLGVSPVVLIAQSALETGWGKKIINGADQQSSLNLFNIKAHNGWQGEKVAKNSLEVEDGVGIKRLSNFRAYNSLAESFEDYRHFISTNQRYQGALQEAGNDARYIEQLQEAGYATDPKYADKIKSIMRDGAFEQVLAQGESNG